MTAEDHGYSFGRFRVVPARRLLEADGRPVPLGSRAFDLLVALLARPGQLVTKDELLAAVWGARVVEENNLTVHMTALRRALGDRPDGERHIVTDPGRGYRFVAPVEILAPPAAAPAVPAPVGAAPLPTPSRLSFLVLAVPAAGSSPEALAFAEEVSSELVVQLARYPDSTVRASVPVGPGEATLTDAGAGGRAHAARHVLETRMWRSGGRVRAAAQLVEASTGAVVWADSFDHAATEPGMEARETVARLVRTLMFDLVDREARQPVPAAPDPLDHALRGWSALQRALLTPEDLAEARLWFERALAQDGTHPASLAGLSYAIAGAVGRRWLDVGVADLAEAEALASRAVAIMPDWAHGWFCRGFAQLWQRRFEVALASLERALAIDACHPLPHAYIGYLHLLAGRLDAMEAPIRRAIGLSPRDRAIGLWHHWLGLLAFWRRRYEEAVAHFMRATDLAPRLGFALAFLASALALSGRMAEAREALAALAALPGGNRLTIARFRQEAFSDHPVYLEGRERLYEGLRRIGLAEA